MKNQSRQQNQASLSKLNKELDIDSLWVIENNTLCKTFQFKNFIQAFGWMSQIAILAEKLNHHPDWSNSYNKVDVYLTTHELKGISELDFQLAEKMDVYHK